MADNLTQKEILLRLMDKVERIDAKQSEHIAFSKAKLQAIEEQARKTNGRVTKHDEMFETFVKRVSRIEKKQEGLAVKVAGIVSGIILAIGTFVNKFL